ncbi:unnamed protein product [marine sediment metagenome]|uniref:Uncharacterized protein n=1 Tax=marine sediment metagenome TaxID=412755 RepID=X1P6Z5_9ZZZZ
MTRVAPHPAQTLEVSRYPNYAQALAYLVNFLRHGRRAFIRTKRYAYYQHSSSLCVLVIRLAPAIFEVRSYPVDGYCFASLAEALKAEDFRAWLFALDYRYHSITYITGSQRVGIDRYKQVKKAIKDKRILARASQGYPNHPNRG